MIGGLDFSWGCFEHISHFSNKTIMFWNLWEVVGESPGSRYGAIYEHFQWNIDVFESPGFILEATITTFTHFSMSY